MIKTQQVPIAEAKNNDFTKVLFIGMTGKMYIPKSHKEVEDEEFSPMLRSIVITSDHTQEEVKEHWERGETIHIEAIK